MPEDAVPGLFHSARIVVLPYQASTGSSSVMMQSASWGRCIVASDIIETRTAASESGLELSFYPPGDIAALTEVLKSHLNTPELRQKQIQGNFTVIQRYLPEATCRAYLEAFNLSLENHRHPKRLGVSGQFPAGIT